MEPSLCLWGLQLDHLAGSVPEIAPCSQQGRTSDACGDAASFADAALRSVPCLRGGQENVPPLRGGAVERRQSPGEDRRTDELGGATLLQPKARLEGEMGRVSEPLVWWKGFGAVEGC